jgi:hypothetical protein
MHAFVSSAITASSTSLNASVSFTGPHPTIASVLPWNAQIGSGNVTLENGANLLYPVTVNGGTLDIDRGCTASTVNLGAAGVLRIHPGAVVNNTSLGNVVNGGRLEVVVDALSPPATAPVSLYVSGGTGGALAVEVLNANSLRPGDVIPLVQEYSGTSGDFSAVELSAIPGGRTLQVALAGDTYWLRVLAGGTPCWNSDFNGDGDFGTDQDIEAFFACLAGHCCPTCGEADFNTDGDIGTDQDIESFFRVLSGAPC